MSNEDTTEQQAMNCDEIALPDETSLLKTITDKHSQEISALWAAVKRLDEENRKLSDEIESVRILCRKGWLSIVNLPMMKGTDIVSCLAELFKRIPIHNYECIPNEDVISIDWGHLREKKYGVLHVFLKNRSYNAMLSMSVQKRIKDYNNARKGANPLNIGVVHTKNQTSLYYLAQQMKRIIIDEQRTMKMADPTVEGELIRIHRFITLGSEMTIGKKKVSLEDLCKERNLTFDALSKMSSDARARADLEVAGSNDDRKRKYLTLGEDGNFVKLAAVRGNNGSRGRGRGSRGRGFSSSH